jgi:ribonucleotide reductase alpha subunit
LSNTVKSVRLTNEIALCNIGAINLYKNFTDDEYYQLCYDMLLTARAVILGTKYEFAAVEYTAKARMSVGIGVTNLAYIMAKNKKYYSSPLGKIFMHELAERHSYFLHKAALQIAKEYGNAPWIHKTKYPEGWLPIDTYNRNVDTIADFKLKYDWETLRAEIIAQGGIAFSVLEAFMP